jgi:putative membrane protein insertion efficiency factor
MVDVSRGSAAVLAMLRFYKRFISPLLPPACRFTPTCSEYMYEAVLRYGAVKGTYLGAKRILRCNPFFKGGFDPVR